MVLQIGDLYGVGSFIGIQQISVADSSLYGSNAIRNAEKIIDLNGILFYDIEKIEVETGSNVVFKFYNSLGRVAASYIMKVCEQLTIKNTSVGALKYKFTS